MDKNKLAEKVVQDSGGIAKASSFAASGLNNYDISTLCKKHVIERIRHGYYVVPGNSQISEEQLLAILLPQSIVCVESALFHYGYSDYTPRQWSVAVSRSASRTVKNVRIVPIRAYYIQDGFLEIGKTMDNFNGTILSVYDRERTICDCFKYRTKIDNELFNKAINEYVSDDKKNLSNLSCFSKEMHLYEKVMNVMEVMLNG